MKFKSAITGHTDTVDKAPVEFSQDSTGIKIILFFNYADFKKQVDAFVGTLSTQTKLEIELGKANENLKDILNVITKIEDLPHISVLKKALLEINTNSVVDVELVLKPDEEKNNDDE